MKRMLVTAALAALVAISVIGVTGCNTTAQKVAFDTAGTTQLTVSTALDAWNVYVGTGKATVAQEQAVKAAYLKYQTAFAAACDLGAIYASTSVTNATASQQASLALNSAIATANQSISDLVAVIQSFGVTVK